MTVIEASAPGKLVLIGEYAVLESAPALSAAVDVRARARIQPADDGELYIENIRQGFRYEWSAGVLRWRDNPGHYGGLFAVAGDRIGLPQACRVSLCTRAFYSADGIKYGAGSSAALSVALCAALASAAGHEPELAVALDVHREFQGGGSGIDVRTSWQGGVIAVAPAVTAHAESESLQWPAGLHILPVWTGVAASTSDRLQRLAHFSASEGQAYRRLMGDLADISRQALTSWKRDDAGDFVDQVDRYARALDRLDERVGLGIWSAEHKDFAAAAGARGLVYKPSGAGGGDFGLVVAADPTPLDELREDWQRAGVECGWPGWTTDGLIVSPGQSGLT